MKQYIVKFNAVVGAVSSYAGIFYSSFIVNGLARLRGLYGYAYGIPFSGGGYSLEGEIALYPNTSTSPIGEGKPAGSTFGAGSGVNTGIEVQFCKENPGQSFQDGLHLYAGNTGYSLTFFVIGAIGATDSLTVLARMEIEYL